jgi:peptide/nickel transport system substrate-binding protein
VLATENFFAPLLTCHAFRAGSSNNGNFSGFCDRRLDALVRHAAALEATDQVTAGRLWAAADRLVVGQAPWVPLVTVRQVTLVSKRVRNSISHPVWGGFVIDQARVR